MHWTGTWIKQKKDCNSGWDVDYVLEDCVQETMNQDDVSR